MRLVVAFTLAICCLFCACGAHNDIPSVPPTQTTDTNSTPSSSEPTTATVPTVPSVIPSAPADPTIPSEPETEPTEPTEPDPIVLPDLADDVFVRISDYIPDISIDLRYATENNFTGHIIYDFTDAYLRFGTLKKLVLVYEELAMQGLGLLIWDAYRPVSAQSKLWITCPDPNYVSPPDTGIRSHCRGLAVDVTLVDLRTGELLEMPSDFDEFSPLGDRDYSDCSPEAAKNALLLEETMKKHGFSPYKGEWWHFADTDTYPVEEDFDPGHPSVWVANCNQYINLRKEPGGSVYLAQIPKGAAMELISWEGKYALVSFNGITGYATTSYIKPADAAYYNNALETVPLTDVYTHEQMMKDLKLLAEKYPDTVQLEIIGKSELGRDIPVLRIGREDAAKHVLLQGAIHGREHMTAWLLMAMTDYWLDHGIGGFGDVCWHILPMTNPDGVTISQTGVLTPEQKKIYESDRRNGYTKLSEREYARRWKANGLGVDLNRNFPAGWKGENDRTGPSSELYKGEAPFSAAETKALQAYTLRYGFDVTVSYHATGSLIYYEYGKNKAVNAQGKELAERIAKISGYPAKRSYGVDAAGYKDWVIEDLKIPSLTIEIGCQDAPLAQRELYSIFVRNTRVIPTIAHWLHRI